AALAPLAESSPGFAALAARAGELLKRLRAWTGEKPGSEYISGAEAPEQPGSEPFSVLWFELTQRGFMLQRTPLDVSAPLRAYREKSRAAWIFTSATLAVAGDFEHIGRRLGLEAPRTLLQPSPFDWPDQALCYLPPGLPEPNQRDYV